MVAPKAKPGMTQYMTDKPTKWGMKGFTLAESTFRFITYTVKTLKASDAVLCLMMWWWTFFSCCLAQDAMFTWTVVLYQSQMFLDLTSTRCGACSIYTGNAWEGGKILSTKKMRIRICEMDQRWPTWYCEVDGHVGGERGWPPSTCMSRVKRKVEDADGHWAVRGADILDQFIQY